MPTSPKYPCPTCGRVGCTSHPRPDDWRAKRAVRPYSEQERKRRAQVVAEWRAQYGDWCPVCQRYDVVLTADHIVPFALTGQEDTPLRVICRECNSRAGAIVGNQRRKKFLP